MIARRSKKTLGYFNSVARDWNTHRYDILGGFDLDREILKYIGNDPVADIARLPGDPIFDLGAECLSPTHNTPTLQKPDTQYMQKPDTVQ